MTIAIVVGVVVLALAWLARDVAVRLLADRVDARTKRISETEQRMDAYAARFAAVETRATAAEKAAIDAAKRAETAAVTRQRR